jgi:hypothetical protein
MKTKSKQLSVGGIIITPDSESVKNDFDLLTKFDRNDQIIGNIGENGIAGCNTVGDKEITSNQLNHSNVQQGNGNERVEQKNIVTTNNGITGISGAGHNIYNYACPPEIVELILKLAKKEGLV